MLTIVTRGIGMKGIFITYFMLFHIFQILYHVDI